MALLAVQAGFTIWLGVKAGDAGDNRFGPPPKDLPRALVDPIVAIGIVAAPRPHPLALVLARDHTGMLVIERAVVAVMRAAIAIDPCIRRMRWRVCAVRSSTFSVPQIMLFIARPVFADGRRGVFGIG